MVEGGSASGQHKAAGGQGAAGLSSTGFLSLSKDQAKCVRVGHPNTATLVSSPAAICELKFSSARRSAPWSYGLPVCLSV